MPKPKSKLTFEIHFTRPSGSEDYVVLSGDTLEEIREAAAVAVEKRGGRDAWSREISNR